MTGKIFHRFISTLSIAVMLFSMTACSSKENESGSAEQTEQIIQSVKDNESVAQTPAADNPDMQTVETDKSAIETNETDKKDLPENETADSDATKSAVSGYGPLSLDEELQHKLNLYLSNYTETAITSFENTPKKDEMIEFGVLHILKNNKKLIDQDIPESLSEEYLYRVSLEGISSTVIKYFGVTLTEDDFAAYHDDFGFYTIIDGYLYSSDVLEGDPYIRCAVVRSVESLQDDKYLITFDGYYFNPHDINPYNLTAQEAEALSIPKGITGEAVISTADINDRNLYHLVSYSVASASEN